MKTLITTIFILLYFSSFGQVNFKWDVIIEDLPENQNQIFSKSKLFIGETWKSAQNVIQVDDKESGVILVKGIYTEERPENPLSQKRYWAFSYSVKFYSRDNRCRIVIEDVHLQTATWGTTKQPIFPITDIIPDKVYTRYNIREKMYTELMMSLRNHLQTIIDLYQVEMKKPSIIDEDW